MSFFREDLDALRRDDRLVAFIERSVEPLLRRWFRAEVRGVERVPEGAALFVGNHSGGFADVRRAARGTLLMLAESFRERSNG